MTDTNLGTYSPEEVQVIISVPAGNVVHAISGYVDGSFVNISREQPLSTLYTGADNTGGRTLRTNRSASIQLSLHQSSSSNDVLTQLYLNDQDARDNTWLFDILIKDSSGRSIYQGRQCFIGVLPDSDFSTTIGERQWTLSVRDLEQKLGGNAQFDPSVEQTLIALGADIDPKFASGT